jgi:small-conductance mechanosensitive channel
MNDTLRSAVAPYLPLLIAGMAVAAGLAAYRALFILLKRVIPPRTADPGSTRACILRLRGPVETFLPCLALKIVLPAMDLPGGFQATVDHLLNLWLIGSLAYLAIRGVNILKDRVLARYAIDRRDNLRARKIHTQIDVIHRIAIVIILLIAFSTMLMTFDKVRQLGTSILASAGIIGIILGIAAQKSIGTLIAGLQIAITQPIRLDDVVIVEGEWGKIEEITLTYVVVKIWDQRRLVVPISHFLEKPFQNWTRTTAELLGTVHLYLDYRVPIEPIRKELKRILEETPLWDRRAAGVQVTDATERTVELRALMSAADASAAWDLRCLVREKLLRYIRETFPDALPHSRVKLERGGGARRQPAR